MDKHEVMRQLRDDHRLPQDEVSRLENLEAARQVNWAGLMGLVAKYGPTIVSEILAVFGGQGVQAGAQPGAQAGAQQVAQPPQSTPPTPAPTPAPAPRTQPAPSAQSAQGKAGG
jgi:hypothetical protein